MNDAALIEKQLALLVQAVKGQLTMSQLDTVKAAATYVPFSGTITGTGTLSVWGPPSGTKFRVKAGLVTGVVTTALVASAPVLVNFADSGDSNRVVAPITALMADEVVGTSFGRDFDLGSGRIAALASSTLVVDIDLDIGAGVVKLAGIVWGDEVVD